MMPDRTAGSARRRSRLVVAALAAAALTLSACSDEVQAASAAPLPEGTFLIDVRTPAEFAEGHLAGALNIPVELPSFAAQIDALPVEGDFLVYCRTGRRAEAAIEYMEARGMSAVNLGSLSAAAGATGRPVVR